MIVLDTNCFINAQSASSHEHLAAKAIIEAGIRKQIEIGVSKHSLNELERASGEFPDGAFELALAVPLIPYFPVGTYDELLGAYDDLAGSYDDMEANDDLQQRLGSLAKAGTSLGDRGAVVDAVRSGAAVFVTSDGELSKTGPAARIQKHLGLRILTPTALAQELAL